MSGKHEKREGAKDNLVKIGKIIRENIIFWTKFRTGFYPIRFLSATFAFRSTGIS